LPLPSEFITKRAHPRVNAILEIAVERPAMGSVPTSSRAKVKTLEARPNAVLGILGTETQIIVDVRGECDEQAFA
jgi:hypothetical protein